MYELSRRLFILIILIKEFVKLNNLILVKIKSQLLKEFTIKCFCQVYKKGLGGHKIIIPT